jgi:hypothetical protein
LVFVANKQTKSNGTWKHLYTEQMNIKFKSLPHNMEQITFSIYINGKQVSSSSNVETHKHTALYDARIFLKEFGSQIISKLN